MVDPHGRLWRASAAKPNYRPMPERRLQLARNRVLPMQDQSKHAARRYPQGARYGDLEARSVFPMPVLRDAALQAASPHDQAD